MENNLKVIVFTSAYNKRPFMLRSCIQDVRNQTYANIVHCINITLDKNAEIKDFSPLYSDLLSEKLNITYSENKHSHFNNMEAIKSFHNYNDYDLFIKMDDDDIHKSNYVKNIVEYFSSHPEIDITSSAISTQLNGHDLYKGNYGDLGGNPENTNYKMPMTFAFTKKALEVIINLISMYHYDDFMWRQEWNKQELKDAEIDNKDEIIWHIHGNNWSVGDWLRDKNEYKNIIS